MSKPTDTGILITLITCPDAETVQRMATALVQERLAASVTQIAGIRSTYCWKRELRMIRKCC